MSIEHPTPATLGGSVLWLIIFLNGSVSLTRATHPAPFAVSSSRAQTKSRHESAGARALEQLRAATENDSKHIRVREVQSHSVSY